MEQIEHSMAANYDSNELGLYVDGSCALTVADCDDVCDIETARTVRLNVSLKTKTQCLRHLRSARLGPHFVRIGAIFPQHS